MSPSCTYLIVALFFYRAASYRTFVYITCSYSTFSRPPSCSTFTMHLFLTYVLSLYSRPSHCTIDRTLPMKESLMWSGWSWYLHAVVFFVCSLAYLIIITSLSWIFCSYQPTDRPTMRYRRHTDDNAKCMAWSVIVPSSTSFQHDIFRVHTKYRDRTNSPLRR